MKKILTFLFFISILLGPKNISFAQDNSEAFYYTITFDTISKYVNSETPTLHYLFLYQEFIKNNIKKETSSNKLSFLKELFDINAYNIQKQLQTLDTNKENQNVVIQYFSGLGPQYAPFLENIKKTHILNAKDAQGHTLFWAVLQNGNKKDIEFALNRGLNPNILDANGENIVFDFVKTGKFYPQNWQDKILAGKFDEAGTIEIIHLLFKKGFDGNLVNAKGENIFFRGVDFKNISILKALGEYAININKKDISGNNVVFYALSQGASSEIIQTLTQKSGFDFQSRDNNGNNLLQTTSDLKLFQWYLDNKTAIGNINTNQEDELLYIMHHENDEKTAVEKFRLLKLYGNIGTEKKDIDGNTPLLLSVKKGRKTMFQTLLENNANKSEKNNQGENILLLSFQTGAVVPKEILGLENIDFTQTNNLGENALFYALKNKDSASFSSLLEKNIPLEHRSNQGENLVDILIKNDDFENLFVLMQHSFNIDDGLIQAVKNKKSEFVKILLKHKNTLQLDINRSDENKQSAIFYAVINNDLEMVKLLSINDALIDEKNMLGQTPLMIASMQGESNIVSYLLKMKANPMSISKEGKTAKQYAQEAKQNHILELLP